MTDFFIGCAVWAYKDWVGDLFPPGSKNSDFLRLYSRRLTTVEGNTTFYATPKADMVQRWSNETPTTFRFCLKLPRTISHSGSLATQIEQTHAFVTRMAGLGQRLGPFFIQLPPTYGPRQIEDLEHWIAGWPPAFALAVEVRHKDWYTAPYEQHLMTLLNRYTVGRVLMDVRPLRTGPSSDDTDLQQARERKPDVPLHLVRSGSVALVRYIGHPDMALNEPFLTEWATHLANWLNDGTQVYAFMHCPDERRSPALCRALQQRLEHLVDIPPLPWDAHDAGLEQATLF